MVRNLAMKNGKIKEIGEPCNKKEEGGKKDSLN